MWNNTVHLNDYELLTFTSTLDPVILDHTFNLANVLPMIDDVFLENKCISSRLLLFPPWLDPGICFICIRYLYMAGSLIFLSNHQKLGKNGETNERHQASRSLLFPQKIRWESRPS